ncbi:Cytochrome P450 CYP9AJ3 [Operophtera brumata]|uniref:unspecific monooxygenase n=1 Tax=Operophtera brumata TaxID=104452 RepID=A0A0L7L5Q1_OPEBR|nr:Cytochrome P450 CYP9AJ3 [Operophtera brumata]
MSKANINFMQPRHQEKVSIIAYHEFMVSGKLKESDSDGNNDDTKPTEDAAFPEVDLVAQAISFYIAGFDTTANLINYFLYEMAINPDVQEKLQHKIDALDAEADVYEQLQTLEYMDMCVRGSRFAIQTAKVFLLRFLTKYRTRANNVSFRLSPRAFILRPQNGYQLIVEPRISIIVMCLYCYSRHRLRYFQSKGVKTLPPIPFLGNLAAATFGKENFITMPYVNDVISSCAFGFAVNTLRDPENSIFKLGKTAIFICQANINFMQPSQDEKVSKIAQHEFMVSGKLKESDSDGNNNDTKPAETNLINYFLYEMAINPDVQEKLQHKIDALDAEADVYEQLQALEYMDMCVSEVLRLWPLVGASDRRSVGTYDFGPTYPGSKDRLIAPAGIHVWLPTYCLHRDEKYWRNPNQCDPERFSPENKPKIVPYTVPLRNPNGQGLPTPVPQEVQNQSEQRLLQTVTASLRAAPPERISADC